MHTYCKCLTFLQNKTQKTLFMLYHHHSFKKVPILTISVLQFLAKIAANVVAAAVRPTGNHSNRLSV